MTNNPTTIYTKQPRRMSKWPPVALLFVFLAVYGWNGIAVQHWDAWPVRLVTAVVPIPAATVNGATITYHELLQRRDVLLWLRGEEAEPIGLEELLGVAMDGLVRERLIEQVAKELEVEVSGAEIEAVRQRIGGDVASLKMRQATFTHVVLAPLALAQKLEQAVWSSDELQRAPRSRMDQAVGELAAGVGFAEVASKYSDDGSASSGGDLGYLTAATLPAGWDALLQTAEGSITPIMETERAFVLAKVAWIVNDGDDAQIRTQVIIVKKKTLDQLIDERLSASQVRKIIK